jgi:hypothetical protein
VRSGQAILIERPEVVGALGAMSKRGLPPSPKPPPTTALPQVPLQRAKTVSQHARSASGGGGKQNGTAAAAKQKNGSARSNGYVNGNGHAANGRAKK